LQADYDSRMGGTCRKLDGNWALPRQAPCYLRTPAEQPPEKPAASLRLRGGLCVVLGPWVKRRRASVLTVTWSASRLTHHLGLTARSASRLARHLGLTARSASRLTRHWLHRQERRQPAPPACFLAQSWRRDRKALQRSAAIFSRSETGLPSVLTS